MGKTFDSLKTLVAGYLNREDLAAYLGDFVNMAQRKIERRNYNAMKAIAIGTLTTTNDEIALPTGYKETISLTLAASTATSATQYRLRRADHASMIARYPYGSTAPDRPEQFATDHPSGIIRVRPYPNGTWYYTLTYYKNLTELSTTEHTNWWTDYAWECLLYGALLEAEPFLMNDSRVATWVEFYKDALKSLRDQETSESISGSHIAINSDYNDEDVIVRVGDYVV